MIRALALAAVLALGACAPQRAGSEPVVSYCLAYGGQAFAVCPADRRYAL